MADLLQKIVNHVHGNRDLLKLYIFHEIKKAKIWRQNPKEVHHLKEKKTMIETFDEMCEVYGNDAMDKQEFEYWYIKFYSGNFDMDHNWSPSENCRPSSLQLFIFSDIVMDVPIWTSFENYCEVEGNEKTDYPDYEFWYMRFARGEFNMVYDRSADPTPRSFVDLPIHVFEKISENFYITDKLIIRKVSKPLQSFIDSWISRIKEITISNKRDETSLCFDNERISYSNQPRHYDYDSDSSDYDSDRSNDPYNDEPSTVHNTNSQFSIEKHWRLGFQALKAFFVNPVLRINLLKITSFNEEHTEHFLAMLKSLNGKRIHVENFEVTSAFVTWNVLPIIQHLKPEVLEDIKLSPCLNDLIGRGDYEERIEQIGEYEQMKKVKMLTFKNFFLLLDEPFGHFLGFPRVTIEVDCIMSSERHAALAIETLVKSTVLKVFYIRMHRYHFDVNATMRHLECKSFPRVPNRENVIRHKVPESDQFYEIEITAKMIRIERMP